MTRHAHLNLTDKATREMGLLKSDQEAFLEGDKQQSLKEVVSRHRETLVGVRSQQREFLTQRPEAGACLAGSQQFYVLSKGCLSKRTNIQTENFLEKQQAKWPECHSTGPLTRLRGLHLLRGQC